MSMTVGDALRAGVRELSNAGVPDPVRDARVLLAHAMSVAPDRLTLLLPQVLPLPACARFDAALSHRVIRRPVSQITGRRLFWGREFRVTRDTLDPRPETETLVAAALEESFASLLDLGTGTGAILLSLMAERPLSEGTGTDISAAALGVAAGNAAALGLSPHLIASDWFADVEGRFDLIVSNPPYIALAEMADLSPEVRDWEPQAALTDGGDGLSAYRSIADGAPAHLLPGGRLVVEVGPTQASAVMALLECAGLRAQGTRRDMDGRERVVIARACG